MTDVVERVARRLAWLDLLSTETEEALAEIGIVYDGIYVEDKYLVYARAAIEEVCAPSDEAGDEAYEDTFSLEELRKEVRREWDAKAALVRALRDLPSVPDWRVLRLLSRAAVFPDDGNTGKAMQKEHGLEAIAPKVEYEMGAGLWKRIRDGLTEAGREKL